MARPTVTSRVSLTFAVVGSLALAPELGGQAPQPVVRRMFDVDSADVNAIAISPDGRWVAYTRYVSENESRIEVKAATGGLAITVTPSGRTNNERPRFTPGGDRILYESTVPAREGDGGMYLMSVPFDTRTGRTTAPPRQITLDQVRTNQGMAPSISPDGKWVAYVQCCDIQRIRVVPITGGNARTLVEHSDKRTNVVNLAWTDNGTELLYVIPQQRLTSWHVMRVAVAGGPSTLVRRSDGPIGMLAPGGHRGAFVVAFGPNQRSRELRIRDEDGTIAHRVRLPDGFDWRIGAWSPDGRSYLGTVRNGRSAIRLASTTGAPTRTLTPGNGTDWPDGWSADGRTLYYETTNEGATTLASVSLDGAKRAVMDAPKGGDRGYWAGVVGRYAIGVAGWVDSSRQVVTAQNIDNGTTIPITNNRYAPRENGSIRGAGGTYSTDGDAYLYVERARESLELHSVVPGQPHRVLRSFPIERWSRINIAVHQGRVIFNEKSTDSIRFMFAASAAATPRVIAAIPAAEGAGEIAWSKDGRHVAFATGLSSIGVLELTPDGIPVGTLAGYHLPFEYMYELSLLNDGRRIAMIAQPRGGPNAVVALVSLDDPSRPVILNEADGTSTWGHMLSPDGQWTAYAADLTPKGSTVFRVDLPPSKR